MKFGRGPGSEYNKAYKALESLHDFCMKHHRDVLGMSNGPFSGVNVALGIIASLEDELVWTQTKFLRVLEVIKNRPKKPKTFLINGRKPDAQASDRNAN